MLTQQQHGAVGLGAAAHKGAGVLRRAHAQVRLAVAAIHAHLRPNFDTLLEQHPACSGQEQ
jgi:hypothetical protein